MDRGKLTRGEAKEIDVAALARSRQVAYRLFSQTFLYPDMCRMETLCAVAKELIHSSGQWTSFSFFPQWDQFLRSVAALDRHDPSTIQADYVSSFLVNSEGVPCPLNESFYLGDEPYARSALLGSVEREYAQAGLFLAPVLGELPDHAAVELEFMAFLCGTEAEAWESQELSRALQALEKEHRFLLRHLTRWFPEVTQRITILDHKNVFAIAIKATAAFLAHDLDLVDTLSQRFRPVER